MPETDSVRAIEALLSQPFHPDLVKFKPAVVSGARALALPYIDARIVMDRLDQVVGAVGWQDEYTPLAGGSVSCRLSLRIAGEWIPKMDVGSPSEQPDEGDQMKAAFSDALKRTAVKFGVGRYLYRIPPIWVDYDAQKRCFAKPPRLPAAALQAPADPKSDPVSGADLEGWLARFDEQLSRKRLCEKGKLCSDVVAVMNGMGATGPVTSWPTSIVSQAVKEARSQARRFRLACGK